MRYQALLEVYGDLDAAAKHIGPDLLKSLGCKQETIQKSLLMIESFDAKKAQKILSDKGIIFLTIEDPRYPRSLKETSDPPVFLYLKGNLAILDQPSIALVGTRQMSAYGRRVAQAFVAPLVENGLVTVSGLASGIDTIVAEETIKAKGSTIAVLAHGLHYIFPAANEKLAERIVENGGLIVTEEALGVEADTFRFPKRNRLVAGLSLGTVVLEAPAESGALITARMALEENREVFVVPGQIFDPHYEGCHALLSKGTAKLVTKAEDVLIELGMRPREATAPLQNFVPEDKFQKAVYNALSAMPQPVDDVTERSKLKSSDVISTLTMLELSGAAKNVGNGMWVRN
jgi:DNA processing protein